PRQEGYGGRLTAFPQCHEPRHSWEGWSSTCPTLPTPDRSRLDCASARRKETPKSPASLWLEYSRIIMSCEPKSSSNLDATGHNQVRRWRRSSSAGIFLRPLDRPAILRIRKPQIFAQRLAFIVLAEQSAALQLRDEQVNDVLQPAWKGQGHEIEAVGRAAAEPGFERIGDFGRRADDDAVAALAVNALVELADGEAFAPRQLDHHLDPALLFDRRAW